MISGPLNKTSSAFRTGYLDPASAPGHPYRCPPSRPSVESAGSPFTPLPFQKPEKPCDLILDPVVEFSFPVPYGIIAGQGSEYGENQDRHSRIIQIKQRSPQSAKKTAYK